MLFDNREQIRQLYFQTWAKIKTKQNLSALEEQIAQVILDHPEYHSYLEHEHSIEAEFPPELGQTNPFLHMGLHLGLREQIQTNRPAGIFKVYQELSKKMSKLDAEHLMMECLVESIWQAQRHSTPPNEADYLLNLQALIKP